ncbi:YhcN/YlaJ family sporulation lipoprotein [Bacillus sp. FJAT-29790]|uniref:YhcN/YlaJ family sporulation lipoprotein n=1 Tax=Bacillus sp. FJAT-29790 TaxID=1895002 RepID=UPI001C21554C|nr:YhcN/YlaJ family sporulation lipoprotein [Bacillus sp. FJAT-29790]MBU8879535.1 YhcN/YlaJ family sporulation lipoprotein [Bacillus sp. FJAT-29790]
MNKKLAVFPIAALMSIGLAGCGATDGSGVHGSRPKNVQPVGYYSNENHRTNGGNAQILDDNDGPVTEIMDHSLGLEGENNRNRRGILQVKTEGLNADPGHPLRQVTDNRIDRNNHLFSRDDINYHGHLGNNVRNARSSYYHAYEGNLSEQISNAAKSVNNVADVRTIVYGNDVLIGVLLSDYSREGETKAKIRHAVLPYTNVDTDTIITDQATFSRIRNIDNDLRDGGPREQIDLDIQNLFRPIRNR